jgi:aryl-alcohol dehydrogenase-like predicted oxidoreductase
MQTLGTTGYEVHTLNLGGNVFGWPLDRAESFAVLDAYVEGGGNFIDTADLYPPWKDGRRVGGESEAIIGEWLRTRADRDRMIVATKLGYPGNPVAPEGSLRPEVIREAVDGSLRRLGVESIDLLYAHQDDPNTPIEQTLATFDEVVRTGKARAIGASNYSATRLRQALAVSDREGFARFAVFQTHFNLLDRGDFEEIDGLCRAEGLPVLTYYALASGFLSGKYGRDAPLPDTRRVEVVRAQYFNERGFRVLDAVTRISERHGATPAQVALAWLMQHPGVFGPVASGTSPEQVSDLLGAATLGLTAEEWDELSAAGASVDIPAAAR